MTNRRPFEIVGIEDILSKLIRSDGSVDTMRKNEDDLVDHINARLNDRGIVVKTSDPLSAGLLEADEVGYILVARRPIEPEKPECKHEFWRHTGLESHTDMTLFPKKKNEFCPLCGQALNENL